MRFILKCFAGLVASIRGMVSMAGFALLAFALPLIMLKMKGDEGREIVRITPKLKASQASVYSAPVLPQRIKDAAVYPVREENFNSFSFGNSIEQDQSPILNRSEDPNSLK